MANSTVTMTPPLRRSSGAIGQRLAGRLPRSMPAGVLTEGTPAAALSDGMPEAEEVLIADPRGTLTPAQMVDQKLLALLGTCPRRQRQGVNGLERAKGPITRIG